MPKGKADREFDLRVENNCNIELYGQILGKTALVNIMIISEIPLPGTFRYWSIKLTAKETPKQVLSSLRARAVRASEYKDLCGKIDVNKIAAQVCFAKVYDASVTKNPDDTEDANSVQSVRVSHILVKTRAEALDLIKQLKQGTKFAALAMKHSIGPSAKKGGDLGFIRRGDTVKAFDRAAFSLNVGEVSKPVKTRFGWHVILLLEKKS